MSVLRGITREPAEPTSVRELADYFHRKGAVQRIGCDVCHDLILTIHVGRLVVHLDTDELLPRGRCVNCNGKGEVKAPVGGKMKVFTCPRCQGAGETGDPLLGRIMALTQGGRVRRFYPWTDRQIGESLHCVHECLQATLAEAA